MACFEIGILYTPAANITTSYKEGVISGVDTSLQLAEFSISVVCDVDYGIPLYATDGSVYTIDGVPVYVRRAKVSDYT